MLNLIKQPTEFVDMINTMSELQTYNSRDSHMPVTF